MRPFYSGMLYLLLIGMGGLMQAQVAAQKADSSAADSLLEAELTKLMYESAPQVASAPATARTSGKQMNPNISVVGAFYTTATEEGATAKPIDTGLSEAEIAFQSIVDPYSRADFYVAFRRETEDPFAGPDEEAAASGEYEAELEEAYVTFLNLPFDLQIKAGKFRSNFGKINQTHPHALNFLDLPRMYVNYFGEEGLGDRGIGFNWLLPNKRFYQELSMEVTASALEGPSFSGESKHLLYLGHIKNFFDLNQETTLELGLSGVYGPNDAEGNKTRLAGADLTIKWKPLRENKRKAFEFMAEALQSRYETPVGDITSLAYYGFLRYQFALRWAIGTRYDYSEFPNDDTVNEKAFSAILNFYATEFQKIELQYQHGITATEDTFNRVMLRAVFVIGAHGAHKY